MQQFQRDYPDFCASVEFSLTEEHRSLTEEHQPFSKLPLPAPDWKRFMLDGSLE
jgi:hypothetical protein